MRWYDEVIWFNQWNYTTSAWWKIYFDSGHMKKKKKMVLTQHVAWIAPKDHKPFKSWWASQISSIRKIILITFLLVLLDTAH